MLHQWQTSTDQSSLGGSSLVKPLFVHPAIKSSLRYAIMEILTGRAMETKCVMFRWLWCKNIKYRETWKFYFMMCVSVFLSFWSACLCFCSIYDAFYPALFCLLFCSVFLCVWCFFCVGFLNVFFVCLFPVAFVLLFFASSSMFLKCLSVFWFNLWYLPPSTAWGPWGHSRD